MNRQHITLADGRVLEYECIVAGVFARYDADFRRYGLYDENGRFLGTTEQTKGPRTGEPCWATCPANGSDPTFFESMYLAADWCRRTGLLPWIG